MPYSQNGYPANDVTLTRLWQIPGTIRQVRLRNDDCGYLLTHFASWFDAHVEDIEAGQLDDWGYAPRMIRGSVDVLSNHASGTALDLNSLKHQLGVRGTFTPGQAAAIRKQLKVYGGCLRWGGDYTGRTDEMHFEINKPYPAVRVVAALLRAGKVATAATSVVIPTVSLTEARTQARRLGTSPHRSVKRIQRALNHRFGTHLTVDGDFGMNTRASYANWQRSLGYHGMQANGVPGMDSLTKLGTGRFRVVH